MRALTDRVMESVAVADNGCWIWQKAVGQTGYGRVNVHDGTAKGRTCQAHRVAYMAFVGPIADGLEIDHLCHTRARECAGGFTCPHRRCVNPAHLEPVTRSENRRRRHPAHGGRGYYKTHCKRGHPFDEANTLHSCGRRICRACQRIRAQK